MKKTILWMMVVLAVGCTAAWAQATKPAAKDDPNVAAAEPSPQLSKEQNLAIRLAVKSMEAAQLKAQVAEGEYATARRDLTDLVKQVDDKPGYTFDLQSLTYQPKPATVKGPGKDPGKP